jgi:hypothetical protein
VKSESVEFVPEIIEANGMRGTGATQQRPRRTGKPVIPGAHVPSVYIKRLILAKYVRLRENGTILRFHLGVAQGFQSCQGGNNAAYRLEGALRGTGEKTLRSTIPARENGKPLATSKPCCDIYTGSLEPPETSRNAVRSRPRD